AYIAKFAHLGNISYRLKDKVFWDEESQKFINNDKADQLILPEYRDPWKLPMV
ncbi:MAG: gfo/Idh/MocA family oxidoreductase, partial [Bacteroidales bacterium]